LIHGCLGSGRCGGSFNGVLSDTYYRYLYLSLSLVLFLLEVLCRLRIWSITGVTVNFLRHVRSGLVQIYGLVSHRNMEFGVLRRLILFAILRVDPRGTS